MRLARALGAIGRTFISAGVLILLFVAYQLWGTGIREAQAQNRLESQFTKILEAEDGRAAAPADPANPGMDPVDSEAVPLLEAPSDGEPTARIRIPKIGVDKIVVQGVSVADLKKGPGHYEDSPLPGQSGNAAIAGHRTTYGAPFNRIDELEPGDKILVDTVQGSFEYVVTEQLVVRPTQVDVLDDKGDDRLTLTSCHPEYSARQRIIVVAKLAPDAVALPAAPAPRDDADRAREPATLDDIDGEASPRLLTYALGAGTALIWLLAWMLGRRWRKWPAYAIGLPFFLVSLYYFFEEFSRLLPSNF